MSETRRPENFSSPQRLRKGLCGITKEKRRVLQAETRLGKDRPLKDVVIKKAKLVKRK